MSTVGVDGGDSKKILDDLREAESLASEVANGGAPSMDGAHDLAKRLHNSVRLLSTAMLHGKYGDVDSGWEQRCRNLLMTIGAGTPDDHEWVTEARWLLDNWPFGEEDSDE